MSNSFDDLLKLLEQREKMKEKNVSADRQREKIPIKKSKEKDKKNIFSSNITAGTRGIITVDPTIYATKISFDEQQEKILKMINNNAPKKDILKELAVLSHLAGSASGSPYEGLYVITNKKLRDKFIDERNNLYLDKFDPEGWKNIENHDKYKEAVNNIIEKAEKEFWKNGSEKRVKTGVEFAQKYDFHLIKQLEYALGKSVVIGNIKTSITENKNGKYNLRVYIRYNLSDKFQRILGDNIPIEWGKTYDMVGPSQEQTIYEKTFDNKREALSDLNRMKKELVR